MSVTLCANCRVVWNLLQLHPSISQTHPLFKHPHSSRCNHFLYFSPSLYPIPAPAFCLLYPLLLLKADFNPTKKHIFFISSLFIFSFFPSPSSSLSISFPPQIHYPLSLLLAKVWSILSVLQPLLPALFGCICFFLSLPPSLCHFIPLILSSLSVFPCPLALSSLTLLLLFILLVRRTSSFILLMSVPSLTEWSLYISFSVFVLFPASGQ